MVSICWLSHLNDLNKDFLAVVSEIISASPQTSLPPVHNNEGGWSLSTNLDSIHPAVGIKLAPADPLKVKCRHQLPSWRYATSLVGFPQQVDQTLSNKRPQQEQQDGLTRHIKRPPPLLLREYLIIYHNMARSCYNTHTVVQTRDRLTYCKTPEHHTPDKYSLCVHCASQWLLQP